MKRVFALTIVASSALFTACASKPLLTESLQQARADVGKLSQDPAAPEVASRELTAARQSLSLAEAAMQEKNQADLDHYSYVATRQSEAGQLRIAERDARRQVAQGEAERNRVLLDARNAELEARKSLAAQETARGTVLTLGDVLFDTGKATLKPGADTTLARVGDFMTKYPKTRLIIEGHTDSVGSEATNFELSQRRAQAVADALAVRGVTRDRIETMGRGPALPVASNDTAEGRQRNRRVEMVFSDNAGRFAEGARVISR